MKISARVENRQHHHAVVLATNGQERSLNIPPKPEGYGSSVNGGELLFLALATCFCNDIYREASKRNINLLSVEVFVSGKFGVEGEPAHGITYNCKIDAPHYSQAQI